MSESDGLAVATDGDRPVEVGRSISVLAVRDPDHRPADLPDGGKCFITIFTIGLISICWTMSPRSQESNLLDYFKLMRACVALLVNVCPALLDMSVTNHSNVHGCRR